MSSSITFLDVTSNTTASAAPSKPPFTDRALVFWFDMSLLCVLAFFFLVFLPRAIARFSTHSEWASGFFLRAGASRQRHAHPRSRAHATHAFDDKVLPAGISEESHTLANHAAQSAHTSGLKHGKPTAQSPPAHVPSWSTLTYPVSIFFSKSLEPGTSVGRLFLQLLYLGCIILLTFINGNPIMNSSRLGFITASQIPVVYILGTKNSIPGILLGRGYEKLNWLHRWVGLVTAITAHVHALDYFYQWVTAGILTTKFQQPYVRWGLVSLLSVDLLAILSISVMRRRAYNVFLYSHMLGIVLVPIAVHFHQPVVTKYLVAAAVFYGLDHVLRLAKTRLRTAVVHAEPALGATVLAVPRLARGWRAGQHVRVRVLSVEMGWVAWTEAHPFTIASPAGGGRGLVLVCKRAGGWTGALYAAAERAAYYGVEAGDGGPPSRKMHVLIEGPYGGLGHMVLASYSAVLIVAGGSGISFGLSTVEDVVRKAAARTARTKFIELVWVAQDKASLVPFIPAFNDMLSDCEALSGVFLKLSVFFTRVSAASQGPAPDALAALNPAISLSAGRPPLQSMVDAIVDRTAAVFRARGVAVGVCGPAALAEDVKAAACTVEGPRRTAIGGIEVHEEVFGW